MSITEKQAEIHRLHEGGMSIRAIARAQGKDYKTISKQLRAAQKWLALDPYIAQGLKSHGVENLDGVSGGWLIKKDGDGGRLSLMFRTKDDAESHIEKVRDAFESITAAPPIIQSEKSAKGKIALFPQSDVHLGVDITSDRGGVEYNPEIAMERMRDGFARAHAAIPACETAIVLDNGDLTHANDDRDVTPRHEHRLKVRGSHRRNLELSVTAKAWQIDMALTRSERVIYRSNRGNHDPNTADVLGIALKQRYRNQPRVFIDDNERETWIFQRGLVFVATHHGHGLKPEKLAANLAPNFPAEFGASRFWYLLTGHLHNPMSAVFGGVQWFQLPSICAMDQHTADMGYDDTAAMRAMRFCERAGLQDDITVRF